MTRIVSSLILSALALAASLPLQAQITPVPPVPSLAPKPGLTTETFESVILSPAPAPGQSVPGWYPLMGPVYDGMNWVPGEVPPATFAAEQGVLRFRSDESSGGPSGRVRQLPDGTSEVCVDLFFYEGALDYSQAGLVANSSIETEMAQYGITIGSWWMGSTGSAPEGDVAEGLNERIYHVSGPGFFHEVEGTLANQWLRLSLQIDASRQVMTVKLNGEVIFSGYPKIFRRDIPMPEGPYEPLPLFTNAGLIGGSSPASEPEGQNAPEESAIITEVFFDNFSHNGSSNAADLTVGPTRAGAARVGNGVYGSDSSKQSFEVYAKYDETATAFFGLQNEGAGAGSFKLRGGASGGAKIRVVNFLYQGSGKGNVTASVRAGTAEVALGGGEAVAISSEASLKSRLRSQMRRLRGRYVNAGQSLSVSVLGGQGVLDAAKAEFSFESAIPATRKER